MSDPRMSNSDVIAGGQTNPALAWLWVFGSLTAVLALVFGIMAGVEFGGDSLYESIDATKGYVLVLLSGLSGLGTLLAWAGALVVMAMAWRPTAS